MPKSKLSTRERQVLFLLAEGKTYREIREKLSISSGNLYTQVNHIKIKTGIRQPRDRAEAHNYFRRMASEPVPEPPTRDLSPSAKQKEALFALARGESYAQMAKTLDVTPQAAMNLVCQGAKRIRFHGPSWKRNEAIRVWVAKERGVWTPPQPTAPPPKPVDPMSDPMF